MCKTTYPELRDITDSFEVLEYTLICIKGDQSIQIDNKEMINIITKSNSRRHLTQIAGNKRAYVKKIVTKGI